VSLEKAVNPLRAGPWLLAVPFEGCGTQFT